jgi:hypothetical protein
VTVRDFKKFKIFWRLSRASTPSLNRTARVMGSKDDHAVPDYKRFLVEAEDGKRRKYANLCANAGKLFAPFATSTWGAFGLACNQVVGILETRLHELDMISLSAAFTKVWRRIQSAVMKHIAMNGLFELEKMEWKRVEVGLIAERLVMLEGWAVRRDQFEHDGDLDFDLRRLDGINGEDVFGDD